MILIITLSSCEKKGKSIFHYPTIQEFKNLKNKDTLSLNQFENFKSIIDTLWYFKKHLKEKNPVFIIENNDNCFYLKTVDLNSNCFGAGLIKFKNLIGISKDSLIKQNKYYTIDSLSKILKTDLSNNGIDNNFADSPKKLIIRFSQPYRESIKDLESNLLLLFKTYNRINKEYGDTLELNIDFEELSIMKPPPPPPIGFDYENIE